jgi:phage shock protein PspC (stress-responsive transcriptional regulator)
MTNQPAANEPAAPEPSERDTAPDNTEPRYEADYLPRDLPPDETQHRVTEPAPRFAEYEAEPPYAEKTPESGEAPPPPPPPPPPGPMPPPPPIPPPGFERPGFDRHRLVRPVNGRYVAGVCAAIGRATNTDPTLWRVLFAVLTLAGGVGLLGYLVGWLLIPGEGDTASPVESMLGRGHSKTSTPLVIGVAALAVLTFAVIVSNNLTPAIIGVAVVVGTAVLLIRGSNQNQQQRPPASGPYTYPGMPPGPFPPGAPMSSAPTTPAPPGAAPFGAPEPPIPPVPPPAPTLNIPSSGAPAMAPPATVPPAPPYGPLPPSPGGYRPPFAPHGPYASSSPYAASLGYTTAPGGPGAPVPPYPGLQPVPARPPKPPRPRSKLGRITLSVLCLALGVLAVVDIAGRVTVEPQVYIGTALAVIALGLILGAWLGRARWLIPVGVILTIALAGSATVDRVDNIRQVDNIDVRPATVAEIQPEYRTEVGDVDLDLSNVQFGTERVAIEVRVGVGGNVTITLPPKVDATVGVDVQGGDLDLFGQHYSGLNQHKQISNLGDDGAGGGNVDLTIDVSWGNVEVNR